VRGTDSSSVARPQSAADGSSATATGKETEDTAESRLLRRLGTPLVLLLLVEVALRARYPWDLLMWSESPFMTNLLKLHEGRAIFSPPADVNSFVYSPGLEYLTYALLAPFGLLLDVRFCRIVNIAVGFAAAALAATVGTRVAAALGAARSGRTFWALACGTILVLFRNFTADVLHPDNLHMLHAVATLLLSLEAVARRRFPLAVAAVALAGMGVWTKQVEVMAIVGAGVAVLVGGRWRRGHTLAIVASGAAILALALALLLRAPSARFHLLDLLLVQAGHWEIGLPQILMAKEPILFGHRLLLLVLTADAIWRLVRDGGEVGRRYLFAWAAVGATTALPCLSAYLKPMGTWNNLGLPDLWMFLLVGPLLVTGAVAPSGLERRLRYAVVLALILSLVPVKLPPTTAMYDYGEQLDRAIRDDVSAGRSVLLAHGTMPLIHAGTTAVPLDRANTALEMITAGRMDVLQPMIDRFRDRAYDRIYLNSPWYDGIALMIAQQYREVATIPGEPSFRGVPISFILLTGHDQLLGKVAIYERNDGQLRAPGYVR
jgi:hypothetical protein